LVGSGCLGKGAIGGKDFPLPHNLILEPFACKGLVTRDVSEVLESCLTQRLTRDPRFRVQHEAEVVDGSSQSRYLVLGGELLDLRIEPYVESSKLATGCLLTPLSLAGVESATRVKRGAVECRINCSVRVLQMPGGKHLFSRNYKTSESCQLREGELLVNKQEAVRRAVESLADEISKDFLKNVRR